MAIRVVVAGLGLRGQQWWREVQKTAGYELAGGVDSDPAVMKQAAASLGIPAGRCFGELGEALDAISCDAVIVATSSDRHVLACETALTRKLALLVEKPFTLHLHDAVKLVSLAERQGAPVVVAQNYRYMRAFRTARQLIADGALGPVGMVICQYYRVPHVMAPSLARLTDSILWGMGVHHLDALCHVLQQRVTGVLAESFKAPWGQLPRGSSMQMLLSFESGTRAAYSATYDSSGHEVFEGGQEFYVRFVGERATLHVFHRWLVLCERRKLPRLVRRGRRKITEEGVLLEDLARAMATGRAPDASGRDNLQTMAVMEACVRSAAARAWVNPQEILDEHR